MAESKRFDIVLYGAKQAADNDWDYSPTGLFLKVSDVAEVLNKMNAEACGHPDYVKVIHFTIETIADHLDIKL